MRSRQWSWDEFKRLFVEFPLAVIRFYPGKWARAAWFRMMEEQDGISDARRETRD